VLTTNKPLQKPNDKQLDKLLDKQLDKPISDRLTCSVCTVAHNGHTETNINKQVVEILIIDLLKIFEYTECDVLYLCVYSN